MKILPLNYWSKQNKNLKNRIFCFFYFYGFRVLCIEDSSTSSSNFINFKLIVSCSLKIVSILFQNFTINYYIITNLTDFTINVNFLWTRPLFHIWIFKYKYVNIQIYFQNKTGIYVSIDLNVKCQIKYLLTKTAVILQLIKFTSIFNFLKHFFKLKKKSNWVFMWC